MVRPGLGWDGVASRASARHGRRQAWLVSGRATRRICAMSDPAADDAPLQRELLELDILLRRKQTFWETPRAVLLIVATTAAVAGVLGWKIGQTQPAPIVVQVQPAPAAH